MTTLIIIFGVIIVFIIGFISPHLAGKIEQKTDEKASVLKRAINWLWDPLLWWAKKSIDCNRGLIKKSAESGKKTRKKIRR